MNPPSLRAIFSDAPNVTHEGVMKRKQLSEEWIAKRHGREIGKSAAQTGEGFAVLSSSAPSATDR
jgi:hypothetical protein